MGIKVFPRFTECDSLLTRFAYDMIAAQLTDLDKPAARALCLQFILHEYAKAIEIASTFSDCKSHELLQGLNQLYPDLTEGMSVMKLGILRKLCFYCEALLETSQKGEELLNVLDDLQLAAAKERRSLKPSLVLFEKFRTFFPLLSKHFEECHESEVPLFSLLELRNTLNIHLGDGTVEALFQKLFDTPEDLQAALSLGFARRGFEGFCRQHEDLFEGLAWEPLIKRY